MYRSSYPLVWDLNDAGSADVTKAQWANKAAAWPTEGSPGSAVGKCDGYVAWIDDANPGSEPSRLGFNFMGWSTKPDIAVEGTGKLDTLVIPKDAPIVEGSDGVKRITLYALWAPVEYSVVFDLTKNPEDASAVPSFNWVDGEGNPLKGSDGFSDLGGGRYRLSGVTLEDYDPATGLIEIATPARGAGGYRFLSWAEPDSQQDPAVAVMKSGSAKWFVNPVALPHYDYEPVLTARWALSFDVDVPSQVTFDQYDSLEVEGNLTDTTDKDMVDEESTDLHDAGKQAHFCSQSTASDYKIVALRSTRAATADDVLTTADSSKASHEDVLGGEKLLSLFAQGATAEEQGVHFKLDDAIDMDDSSRYGSFVVPKQTKSYADSDYSRKDENRLYVSYRLNLDNKVDGATEPNHGLVVASAPDYARTRIANVSYEFAVADDEVASVKRKVKPIEDEVDASEPLYVEVTDAFLIEHGIFDEAEAGTYGLTDIKAAADDLSANGEASRYWSLYHALCLSAEAFKLKVGSTYYDVQVLGLCQDTKSSDGQKAGLSFGFKGFYTTRGMNSSATKVADWNTCDMRTYLQGTFFNALDERLRDPSTGIVGVDKRQLLMSATNMMGTSTNQTVFLLDLYEIFGVAGAGGLYEWFQYQYFEQNGAGVNPNPLAIKSGLGVNWYWTRTGHWNTARYFRSIINTGTQGTPSGGSPDKGGVAPCFCL